MQRCEPLECPLPRYSFHTGRQKTPRKAAFSFKSKTPAKAWKHLSIARCCFKTL